MEPSVGTHLRVPDANARKGPAFLRFQAPAQLAHSQPAHGQLAQPQLAPVQVVHSQAAHLQVPQPQSGDCWVAAVEEPAAWMLVAEEVISGLQRSGW